MKQAKELYHASHVSVAVIIDPKLPDNGRGGVVGSIVWNFSDNPNGSTATATIYAPIAHLAAPASEHGPWIAITGKAGGYGYDKKSASVYSALYNNGFKDRLKGFGHGDGRTEELFKEVFGFILETVL